MKNKILKSFKPDSDFSPDLADVIVFAKNKKYLRALEKLEEIINLTDVPCYENRIAITAVLILSMAGFSKISRVLIEALQDNIEEYTRHWYLCEKAKVILDSKISE